MFKKRGKSVVDEDHAVMAATGPESAAAEALAHPEPALAPVEPEPTSPPKKKSRSMAWVGYVILLGIAALAGGGWFLLQELRSRQDGLGGQITTKDQQLLEVTRQLSAVQSELASLHSQVAAIQSDSATGDAKLERVLGEHSAQLNDRLESARAELGGAVQNIQRQLNKNRGDLMVADAEYLLSIANQKLHLIGHVKSALAAMEAADQRLHDSGDPAVFKVREALADEIGTLKKLETPDVVGISAKLLSIENKVKDLPLFLPHAGTVQEHAEKERDARSKNESEPVASEAGNQDIIDSTLKDIKGLVTVRRTDRPITAVLTPEEAEGYRELLLLKLETARIALLRADDALFQSSLTTAREWLKQHFEQTASEVQEMDGDIAALVAQPISVSFPDISKSLTLLRNIEKLRLEADQSQTGSKTKSLDVRKSADEPVPSPAQTPAPSPASSGEGAAP